MKITEIVSFHKIASEASNVSTYIKEFYLGKCQKKKEIVLQNAIYEYVCEFIAFIQNETILEMFQHSAVKKGQLCVVKCCLSSFLPNYFQNTFLASCNLVLQNYVAWE